MVDIKLVDMSGRVLKQVQTNALPGENTTSLSLGELSNGIYTIMVYQNDALTHTTRVTKQ